MQDNLNENESNHKNAQTRFQNNFNVHLNGGPNNQHSEEVPPLSTPEQPALMSSGSDLRACHGSAQQAHLANKDPAQASPSIINTQQVEIKTKEQINGAPSLHEGQFQAKTNQENAAAASDGSGVLNACFLCGKDDEKEELTKLAELVKLDSEDAEEGEAPADNIVKGETAEPATAKFRASTFAHKSCVRLTKRTEAARSGRGAHASWSDYLEDLAKAKAGSRPHRASQCAFCSQRSGTLTECQLCKTAAFHLRCASLYSDPQEADDVRESDELTRELMKEVRQKQGATVCHDCRNEPSQGMQYCHGADLKIKHARSLEDEDMEEDDIALPSSQSPAKDKNVHSKEDNGHANGDDEMLSPRKDEGLEIEGGKASTGKVRDFIVQSPPKASILSQPKMQHSEPRKHSQGLQPENEESKSSGRRKPLLEPSILGKRSRRAPNRDYDEILDNEELAVELAASSSKATKKLKSIHENSSNAEIHQTQLIEQSGETLTPMRNYQNSASRQPTEQDPFSNPFINEIFKPIMAVDKLSVLRKGKEDFDILIKPVDLKVLAKDKREQLLADYNEGEDAMLQQQDEEEQLEEPWLEEELPAQSGEDPATKKQKRRRKKVGSLSRQANRRIAPGSELTWLQNTSRNIKLLEEQRAAEEEAKRLKRQGNKLPHNSQLSQPSQQPLKQASQSDPHSSQAADQDNQQIMVNISPQSINGLPEIVKEEDIIIEVDQNALPELKLQGSDDAQNEEEAIQIPEAHPPEESNGSGGDQANGEPGQYVFKGRESCVRNTDDLYTRYNQGYYHTLEALQDDFQWLIESIIQQRCQNQLARDYLTKVLQSSLQHLDRKKNDFGNKWRAFFEAKFKANLANPHVNGNWYKSGGPKREYNNIDNYKIVVTEDTNAKANGDQTDRPEKPPHEIDELEKEREYVKRKMWTTKKSHCNGQCCSKNTNNSAIKLENVNEEKAADGDQTLNGGAIGQEIQNQTTPYSTTTPSTGPCACVNSRVECGADCGCDETECSNRQMSLGQSLKLGVDVEEHVTWGMDMYTAMNLIELKPRDIPWKVYSEFIERRLMCAIQQQGVRGWDIREALQFIIDAQSEETAEEADPESDSDKWKLWLSRADPLKFSSLEKYLAKLILSAISNLKGQNDPHFKIHSKGLGIFCKRKEGIQKDSLVVEYFGEIYPQWLWYEKQDVLKQGQNKDVLSAELPDFYNITYERHFDDPEGYDILTVDPILYGNYSSRLSHSCNPNCQTIIKVRQVDEMYSIGMFAMKDISYGEELSFNYCSTTESEKEFEAATCLCGTGNCSGRFLQLAMVQKNQGIMKEYHSFVDRNLILYKAIELATNGEGIVAEDESRLAKHGLRSSVFQDIPAWLKKWASLICEFIEFEQIKYPEIHENDYIKLYGKQNAAREMQIDLRNLRETKISNIAITIDKVQHVLKQMNTSLPPIQRITFADQFKCLWQSEDSIKANLLKVIAQIEKGNDEVDYCMEFVNALQKELDSEPKKLDRDEAYYERKCAQIRDTFDFISQNLRSAKSTRVAIPALCDNLMLYSKTLTYFSPNDYFRCRGREVCIRKCDVHMTASASNPVNLLDVKDSEKTVYKGTKEYGSTYIWGQLVGWFKQTVDKPNASLSADRRGTLSMPDLESFMVTAKNQENLSSGTKKGRRRGKKDSDGADAEVMPTGGTASRRGRKANCEKEVAQNGAYQVPEGRELKITYPNKKHSTRTAFLENWNSYFAKPWDVCCHWSFKNKHRLYGSVQFESVLQAGTDRDRRLDYFKAVVNRLREYQ